MKPFLGIASFSNTSVHEDIVIQLQKNLADWIPDAQGHYSENGFACIQILRHNTKTSLHEKLPFVSQCQNYLVLADARIDNRDELSYKLEDKSVQYLPDNEIILRAYLKWGETFVKHLQGAFAFVIRNKKRNSFFCGCDILGQVNFYYRLTDHYFIFGTNIGAIRNYPGFNTSINERCIVDTISKVYRPNQDTIYNEINCLRPAQTMVIKKRYKRIERYWTAHQIKDVRYSKQQEYLEHFQQLFSKVTQEQLRTEFPIASYLSGGMDSSSVAAMAASSLKKSGKRLIAYGAVPHSKYDLPVMLDNYTTNDGELMKSVSEFCGNIDLSLIENDGSLLFDPSRYFHFAESVYTNLSNWSMFDKISLHAQQRGVRTILCGEEGNNTISYMGSEADILNHWQVLKMTLKNITKKSIRKYFKNFSYGNYQHPNRYLRTELLKKHDIVKRKVSSLRSSNADPRAKYMDYYLCQQFNGLGGTFACIDGIERRDPTGDTRMIEFCLGLPNEIYYQGDESIHQRMLIRNGMQNILADTVRLSTTRGIQAADAVCKFKEIQVQLIPIVKGFVGRDEMECIFDVKAILQDLLALRINTNYFTYENYYHQHDNCFVSIFQSVHIMQFIDWILKNTQH